MVAWRARWGAQEERAGRRSCTLLALRTRGVEDSSVLISSTVYGWGGVVLGLGPSCNGGAAAAQHQGAMSHCPRARDSTKSGLARPRKSRSVQVGVGS